MERRNYSLAGWMAIASAVLYLPLFVLGILLNPKLPALTPLLVAHVPLALAQAFCAIYAMVRFRDLLNERFSFHEVDRIILAIVICYGAFSLIAVGIKITSQFVPVLVVAVLGLALLLLGGVPLATLGIILSVRLLRMQQDLYGMLKPYAYTNIATSICFLTICLAPLGLLGDAAASILLAIIFFRADKGHPEVEFV